MSTFDDILPRLTEIFTRSADMIHPFAPLLINRDLNGRVRLIAGEQWQGDGQAAAVLDKITREMQDALGSHAYPADQALMFDSGIENEVRRAYGFPLVGTEGVYVVERLATEVSWSSISPPSSTTPRLVFYSVKGGVGRSTGMAVSAWSLAEKGKRVLVLDLDLESPGLSSSLLPEDRRPAYGIADWLVEDLVNNGDAVFGGLVASSALSHDGEILVVPAHGVAAGEYVAKLGRVWMPKITGDRNRESWSGRLQRLLRELEDQWRPDVTLIDSRAGIDEVAAACLTGLSASGILLFAIDGDQTWTGYRMLLRHWRTTAVVREIRERLQIVGAMLPDTGTEEYFEGLREHAWDVFSEELYDEVPPGEMASEDGIWNFEKTDLSAPHYPWGVRWHRGFAALNDLHSRLHRVDPDEIRAVFGPLVDGVQFAVDASDQESP